MKQSDNWYLKCVQSDGEEVSTVKLEHSETSKTILHPMILTDVRVSAAVAVRERGLFSE